MPRKYQTLRGNRGVDWLGNETTLTEAKIDAIWNPGLHRDGGPDGVRGLCLRVARVMPMGFPSANGLTGHLSHGCSGINSTVRGMRLAWAQSPTG
jgi:hypothetical protein